MSTVSKTIVLLPGDGIGPEVIGAAARVLEDCAAEFGHRFELVEFPIGGAAIDATGNPLPAETLDACRSADAVLLGAVGGPRWDELPIGKRPESGLLALRQELGLYVNLRPIRLREPLRGISPLKPARTRSIDFEIVRELAGGIYFGHRHTEKQNGTERASDTETYSTDEIERVARFAFSRAEGRAGRLASVDKANVLVSSSLWRRTVTRLGANYPAVRLEHLYVDNAAMQLILAPGQFDVMLTSNMFGDILSDAAAALVGSIGLVPSMSSGFSPPLFEPIHGSAPQLAGKDVACPIGAILCTSLMLREAFQLDVEAEWVETAVDRVLAAGYRTPDIAEPGSTIVGCSGLITQIRSEMRASLEHLERYGWGV
jgi:3-isopropylmalate dehydrogenase